MTIETKQESTGMFLEQLRTRHQQKDNPSNQVSGFRYQFRQVLISIRRKSSSINHPLKFWWSITVRGLGSGGYNLIQPCLKGG